jgi:hypothetical protein
MKRIVSLCFLAFMTVSNYVAAQIHYEAGLVLGLQHTLAQRGPQYNTNVSDVKFLKPLCRSVGLLFDIKPEGKKVFYGIEFMYDDNDFGYKAESHNIDLSQGVSITSGDMTADDWLNIYKGGIRIGYPLYRKRKIQLLGVIIPSLGYYKFLQLLSDTSDNNFWRTDKVEVQYINYPTWQRQGVYFFLKGTMELQYKWNRHFASSIMMSYQQGFKPFVIDTMNIIRPFGPAGPQQHKYWTKVNGTALQWHFGFKYTFGNPRQLKDSE